MKKQGRYPDQTVNPIQNAAMTRQQGAKVLDS
jgi:hypothetical protein